MLKKTAKPISHILLVTLLALFSSKAVCSQFLDSFDFEALKSRTVTQDGNYNPSITVDIDKKDTEFYIELKNIDNKYYSIPFKFGSDKQPINLVVDTQTDWTIVQSQDCLNCVESTERYNRGTSSSYKKSPVTSTSIAFGEIGQLVGKTAMDNTCLQTNWGKDVCVESGFSFFEVQNTKDINLASQYSGIIGIAPDDPSNGPSFVAKLYDE